MDLGARREQRGPRSGNIASAAQTPGAAAQASVRRAVAHRPERRRHVGPCCAWRKLVERTAHVREGGGVVVHVCEQLDVVGGDR